jgi:hypothetical protein
MRVLRSASDSVSVGDAGDFSSLANSARSLGGSRVLASGGKRKLAKVLMSAWVRSFVRFRQHNGMLERSSARSAGDIKSWWRMASSWVLMRNPRSSKYAAAGERGVSSHVGGPSTASSFAVVGE